MKKKLLIILTILINLYIPTVTYSDNIKFSGNYYARGSYYEKLIFFKEKKIRKYNNFDHKFDIKTKFIVDNYTFMTLIMEMHDETWSEPTISKTNNQINNNIKSDFETEVDSLELDLDDDNIQIKNIWLTHKLITGTNIDIGLMALGSNWGTNFGNESKDVYQLRLTQNILIGSIMTYIQKDEEYGDVGLEDEDNTKYGCGAILNFGKIHIMPHLSFTNNGYNKNYDTTIFPYTDKYDSIFEFDFAVTCKLINIDFESEFIYIDGKGNKNKAVKDYNVLGLYINIYKTIDQISIYKFDQLIIGGLLAYGSVDKNANVAFNFGDDMDSMLILGDEIEFGGKEAIGGMSLAKIYINNAITDRIYVRGALAYLYSNYPSYKYENIDKQNYKDASAFEIDLIGEYKITNNLIYYIGFAYADIELHTYEIEKNNIIEGSNNTNIRAFHKIALSF
jgi:hypothetical protein